MSLGLSAALLTTSSPVAGSIARDCYGLDPTISGSEGNDFLVGTAGDDVISAEGGDDVILGKDGNDVVCGGDGNDLVSGGKGIDFVVGGPGADTIRGDTGTDWLFDADPTIEVEPVAGIIPGTLDDSRDILIGGNGTDLLTGEGGDDVLIGGSGRDYVHGLVSPGSLAIDLGAGLVWSAGGGTDTLRSIENAVGSSHPDVIVGDAGPNQVGGLSASDRLLGGGGVDVLFSSIEGSEISGGGDAGDMLWILSPDPVRVDLTLGTARATGGSRTVDAIEGFTDVVGTQFDDVLIGDGEANALFGVGGSDRLIGGDGDDSLLADGPDYLRAQAEEGRKGGADFLDGGEGNDLLDGGPLKDGCVRGETKRSCETNSPPDASSCTDPDLDCTWPLAIHGVEDPTGILTMLVNGSDASFTRADLEWMWFLLSKARPS